MSWLTGVGITCAGVFITELRTYLLPIGISIILTALGLDLGFNFIPHAKTSIAERRVKLEATKQALETKCPATPQNATVPKKTIVFDSKNAEDFKEKFGNLLKGFQEQQKEEEDLPLSSE